ncbi:MAG: type II toxin-antitoxin system HicA family toxin [Terracidiphilus sp.]
MSKLQKAIHRLAGRPTDYTWEELVSLMAALGFELRTAGGSGRKFFDPASGALLLLHEPHPAEVLKAYQIRAVLQFLRQEKRIP